MAFLLPCLFAFAFATTAAARYLGFYCLIADDTVPSYTSTSQWQPQLYAYQQSAFNMLWLTFINPSLMPAVPPAMANLAKCKGQSGCPSVGTPVIFSIGGEAYSKSAHSWPWLASQSAALAMAAEVAKWDTLYGADGIDLDIENPVGNSNSVAANMVLFVQQLKKLNPKMLITQPVYGEPQCKAEDSVLTAGFNGGQSTGLVETVGIMVYNGVYSLTFVDNYSGAPYHIPSANILPGFGGAYPASDITGMANSVVSQRLGGFMVWFASVYDSTRNQKAFNYGGNDATIYNMTTGNTWAQALKIMN